MRKWVLVLVLMLSIGGLAVFAEEVSKPPEKSDVAEKPVPPVKVEPIMVPPSTPLGEAKVLDKPDLQKFLPKAPKGWLSGPVTGRTQRPGVFAVTKVQQLWRKGGQRITVILEDLGSNNPYFFMKEPWKPYEKKTEDGYNKKIMLGKVVAEESFRPKEKLGLIFLVFEKRIQLNVSGNGFTDTKLLVETAKKIDFEKLKKAMEEQSK